MKLLYLILFFHTREISAEKPNIVFILTDDLGWADTTLNNPNLKSTPFLGEI